MKLDGLHGYDLTLLIIRLTKPEDKSYIIFKII